MLLVGERDGFWSCVWTEGSAKLCERLGRDSDIKTRQRYRVEREEEDSEEEARVMDPSMLRLSHKDGRTHGEIKYNSPHLHYIQLISTGYCFDSAMGIGLVSQPVSCYFSAIVQLSIPDTRRSEIDR